VQQEWADYHRRCERQRYVKSGEAARAAHASPVEPQQPRRTHPCRTPSSATP
jgi:hypothetical protein